MSQPVVVPIKIDTKYVIKRTFEHHDYIIVNDSAVHSDSCSAYMCQKTIEQTDYTHNLKLSFGIVLGLAVVMILTRGYYRAVKKNGGFRKTFN